MAIAAVRYDNTSKRWQVSIDGGAFGDLVENPLHDYITLVNQGSDPSGVAGHSTIYAKTAGIFHRVGTGAIEQLYSKPACTVKRTTDQTTTTSVLAVVNFDVEEDDNDGLHDNVTNNTRITFSRAGRWRVRFQGRFAGNATGIRTARITKNGTTVMSIEDWTTVTATVQDMSVETERRFASGDYVEAGVFQDSGGNLALQAVSDFSPIFTAVWLSP